MSEKVKGGEWESLRAEWNSRYAEVADTVLEAALMSMRDTMKAEAERDAALAELADIKASYRATIEEPCDAGQVHCTCVPALRAEVERMRSHADRLADALERAEQLLSRANAELEKHKSGRNMWHDIANYFDPAELGGFVDALAAYRASAQKEGE